MSAVVWLYAAFVGFVVVAVLAAYALFFHRPIVDRHEQGDDL